MNNVVTAFPRLDFNPAIFEKLILEHGMNIAWEKAAMCPCVRADGTSGTPSFNCGVCYNGNIYVDRRTLVGAITNLTAQRNAQVWGEIAVGGLYLTVPGAYRLGINDRITLVDQTMRYAELCEFKGAKVKAVTAAGTTTLMMDHTRRFPTPAAGSYATVMVAGQEIRYTGKTISTLTGIPASGTGSITASLSLNADVQPREYLLRYPPKAIFDARIMDNAGVSTQLVRDVDFEISDGRRIRFLPGRPQASFTILYDAEPVYLIDNLAHEFRDQNLLVNRPQLTFTRFPVACVLKRDFVSRVG